MLSPSCAARRVAWTHTIVIVFNDRGLGVSSDARSMHSPACHVARLRCASTRRAVRARF